MSAPIPFLDLNQVRRNFTRAAPDYDAVSFLQREIASRMLERLDYMKIEPKRILDLGCATGASLTALSERYPKSQVLGVDICTALLQAARSQRSNLGWLLPFLRRRKTSFLAADALALPFRQNSIAMVWSNLMLHWLDHPLRSFRELHRVMDVGGLLMFSTLGPDTLKELRASFSDGHAHTHRFTDMHDYGDMLLECGFADPVMDTEVVTMTYSALDDLFRDLRKNGASCALQERQRGLMGRSAWLMARANYEKMSKDGRLPATFEVVYGHAWKAQPTKISDGRAIVRFEPGQQIRRGV